MLARVGSLAHWTLLARLGWLNAVHYMFDGHVAVHRRQVGKGVVMTAGLPPRFV